MLVVGVKKSCFLFSIHVLKSLMLKSLNTLNILGIFSFLSLNKNTDLDFFEKNVGSVRVRDDKKSFILQTFEKSQQNFLGLSFLRMGETGRS